MCARYIKMSNELENILDTGLEALFVVFFLNFMHMASNNSQQVEICAMGIQVRYKMS